MKNYLQGGLPQCHTSTHENIPAFPPKIMHKCAPMKNNPMLCNETMIDIYRVNKHNNENENKVNNEKETVAPFGLESSLK